MSQPHVTLDRFWAKVDKTGDCWVWTGYRNAKGYGHAWWEHRVMQAHRLSWEIHFGPIPLDLLVCHHCDNPPCVRPDHLFLGSRAANARDSVRKGRQTWQRAPGRLARGERVGGVRLTEAAVREIRARRADGETYRALADAFGVTHGAVFQLVQRKTWRHVA